MLLTKPKHETEKCKKEDCTKWRVQENEYCALHQKFYQRCVFLEETARVGKKTCYNVIRGCRSQMSADYGFSKCGVCLDKERAKDHVKRGKALESVKDLSIEDLQEKTCTICCFLFPMADFVGQKEGVITKSCIRCRNDNKKQDLKRDKVHREALARIADQKPDRRYHNYIKSANKRNIGFELSKESFLEITAKECYYCGEKSDEKENNGIDRLDASVGYVESNSVSCCKMCNYLKGALDIVTFLCRVEHILSYQKKIDNQEIRHMDCFGNAKNVNYDHYRFGALQRKKEFEINRDQFQTIISNNCYICGKSNAENHQNGIDRIQNNIGYVFENCASCCCECNVMKNDFDLEMIYTKMIHIYNIHSGFQENDYSHIPRKINYFRKK